MQNEPDVNAVVGCLQHLKDPRDRFTALVRAAEILCPDLEEDEVQELLCDLALALEIAAGRASYDDAAWVNYSVRRA